MQIDNLKELQKLIKACRALGVEKIEIDGIKLELGAMPGSARKTKKLIEVTEDFELGGINANTPIPAPNFIKTDELSEEQLLYYSAQSVEPIAESN